MRISVLASLLAALTVSACNSTSSVNDLGVGTSQETTSSIARPIRPVPQVEVAGVAQDQSVPLVEPQQIEPQAPQQQQAAVLAPAPKAQRRLVQPVAAPKPERFEQVEPQVERFDQTAPVEPVVEEAVYATPNVKPVPLIDPGRPSSKALPFKGHKTYSPRFKDADPVSWGPVKPKNFSVHGVDVSRWQGNVDWQTLRSRGANFAFIKATDGGDHLDPMFRKHWVGAGQAGIKRGAYHFFYWCRSGEEQAKWFIRNVPKQHLALPPVIDVEYNHQSSCKKRLSPELVRKKMKAFMNVVEAHYGQRPIIYTAPDFYADNLKGAFKDYPFWLRSTAAHPSKRYPNRNWVFWQYSGTGLSSGVKGEIDLNVFNGTQDDWNRWLAKSIIR